MARLARSSTTTWPVRRVGRRHPGRPGVELVDRGHHFGPGRRIVRGEPGTVLPQLIDAERQRRCELGRARGGPVGQMTRPWRRSLAASRRRRLMPDSARGDTGHHPPTGCRVPPVRSDGVPRRRRARRKGAAHLHRLRRRPAGGRRLLRVLRLPARHALPDPARLPGRPAAPAPSPSIRSRPASPPPSPVSPPRAASRARRHDRLRDGHAGVAHAQPELRRPRLGSASSSSARRKAGAQPASSRIRCTPPPSSSAR